jgi:hypothetical protein
MVLAAEHARDLKRLRPAFRDPLLMLGAAELAFDGYGRTDARAWFADTFGIRQYITLDLADGDLKLDLNDDLSELAGKYATVVNYGTLEHVWNTHQAWLNALRAVEAGGTFVSHSPVGGWCSGDGTLNHGVHMTADWAIAQFLEKNGFRVVDQWLTQFRQRGKILWLTAKRERLVEQFEPVYQVRGYARSYRNER